MKPRAVGCLFIVACVTTVLAGCGSHSSRLLGSSTTTVLKIAAGDGFTVALKSDGSLWAWGGSNYGQLGLGDTRDRHTPTEVGGGSP